MTINNKAIYTHKFIVVYAFEENSVVVLAGFAFHYFVTIFWVWNQGIPLGPSGYRETAPVGMNDELDEPSPIAWRDAGRRGGPGDARSGDGGLARTGGLAGAAFAWGRAPGRARPAAADPATGRVGTCSWRHWRACVDASGRRRRPLGVAAAAFPSRPGRALRELP